ncbi:MAG: hypothetical protein WCU00_05370 [Candidatus Latescibacterota bacterium]
MKWLSMLMFLLLFPGFVYGQTEIVSVRSGKIHYLPDERAVFIGTVQNSGSAEAKATVNCRLYRHLGEEITLGSRTVTVPPKGKADSEFSFPLDGVEYGYEVQMWLEGGGKKISDYFGVSRNVIKIGIMGDSPYANYTDVFAWAPDDFGNLSPKGEHWWSGQGNYDYTKARLNERMRGWHDRGVKAVTYGKGVSGGPTGMDILIEHPDWSCYNRFGQLGGMNMAIDIWSLKNWDVNNHGDSGGRMWQFWNCWTPNFYETDAVLYGAQALVDGAKMFGWDGVRFDAQFDIFGGFSYDSKTTDHGENRDALNVRNLRLTKEHILKTFPDFIFGYNYGAVQNPPTEMDREVCKGGGLIMDEGFCDTSAPQHPDNPWINFARRIINEVKATGSLGGCQIVFEHNRMGVTVIADNDYGLIFCFAGGGRPYLWNYKSTRYRLDRFTTRYSEYLLNDDIKRLSKPEERFRVQRPATIWWKDWAGEYAPSEGRTQYILHLINPPQKKGIGSTPFPAPQNDISVDFMIPEGQELAEAWLLSPEPEVNGRKLSPVHNENGTVTFKVESLDLWKLLVVEVRRTK